MSETRFCENCRRVLRGPEFGDGVMLCRGCLKRAANLRARAAAAAIRDPGNRVTMWVLTGLAALAGVVMVGWKLWDVLRARG